MVKDAPKFVNIAKAILSFFEGCDIAGFNSDNYDVPLLMTEFERVGLTFPDWDCVFVDVLKYERLLHSNKLTDVYKRYTGLELENAHSAIADIKATIEIFMCQTKDMEVVDPQEIDLLCQGERKRADIAGKMYLNEESEVCWSFGKNMGKTILSDIPYAEWVLKNNFPSETKEKIRKIINR
jgi:DNA polymerase-3 subunit epsilon